MLFSAGLEITPTHIYLEDVSGKPMPRIRVLKSTAREFLGPAVKLAYDSE